MPKYQRIASFLLLMLASACFARGTIYKCQDTSGRVTLRDERCRAEERQLATVQSNEVPRHFSFISSAAAPQTQRAEATAESLKQATLHNNAATGKDGSPAP